MADQNLRGMDIVNLLKRNDRAIGRALAFLLLEQTHDEQAIRRSRHENKRGFNKADALKGTEHAQFFNKNGHLTPEMIAYWREPIRRTNGAPTIRIAIYWHQLLIQAYRNGRGQSQMAA